MLIRKSIYAILQNIFNYKFFSININIIDNFLNIVYDVNNLYIVITYLRPIINYLKC